LIGPLDRAQMFTGVFRACFHWGSYAMLLCDEDVSLVELVYRIKRAITFDPAVGSRSNFYRGFQRLFSYG